MHHQLSCEQVTALMGFYVENKLSAKLSQYVYDHLQKCPECMEKFNKMQSMIRDLIDINSEPLANPYNTRQYEDFKLNLSAYIDNELDDSENIKIKKIAISNPLARQDLENIYTFKKLLHGSFEKTKNEFKQDFSKNIVSKIDHQASKQMDPFLKLTTAFFVMISCIVAGLVYFLYF